MSTQGRPFPPELGLNLALALVESSNAPILLLDEDFTVVAASASFCDVFQLEPTSVPNKKIFELGTGEWDVPQLRSLLSATISGQAVIPAYGMDLSRQGRTTRRLLLNAQKLDYGKNEHVRLVLAISDVTKARLSEKIKEDLLREKGILLQEVQHRVANSLQIIASVLLQSARKVQSEETRGHLHDAHSRVMSIASVQQLLAVSTDDDVALRSYFAQLCQSLGASMIYDHKLLSVDANTDDTVTSADVSVSLGLIVTELVINALKHAFPDFRSGKILVDYESHGPEWALSVTDNGVGMPSESKKAKSGLGSSIVSALATQLDAVVKVAEADPGTKVSVVHSAAESDGRADRAKPAL